MRSEEQQEPDLEFVGDVPLASGGPGSRSKLAKVAEKLHAQPGEWAIVRRKVTQNSSGFSTMKQRLEHLGCEATTRRVDGELRLYARWPEEAAS